jgi:hypothetical protein
MAPMASSLLQEQELSQLLATFAHGEQQQVADHTDGMSTQNHPGTTPSQHMDPLIFESEPYVEIQEVPDGSDPPQPFLKTRAKMRLGVGRSKTKKFKAGKTPAVKQAMLQKTQSHSFALQHWLDQPYEVGPFFMVKDPVANQIYSASELQDLPWNFLEGRSTTEERANGSAVDELVRGVGTWAGEGELPPFESRRKQGKRSAQPPDAPWGW